MDLSIVIPVFNSTKTLYKIYSEIIETCDKTINNYEIIFVDDCSEDDSWLKIKSIAKNDGKVIGITLNKNYGQHNAILCGIRQSQGALILTLDDDLQHPPSEIPLMLKEINKNYDLVYGVPKIERHGLIRNFMSNLIKIFLKYFFGAKFARNISAFCIFRSILKESFKDYNGPNVNIDSLLSMSTQNISSLNVLHNTRKKGRSGYNIIKLINYGTNMITSFSILPLRVASLLGILFSILGIVLLFIVILDFIFNINQSPGFTFLASLITIFSGVQLFSLGVIGEYLGKLYLKNMGYPSYTINEISKKNK